MKFRRLLGALWVMYFTASHLCVMCLTASHLYAQPQLPPPPFPGPGNPRPVDVPRPPAEGEEIDEAELSKDSTTEINVKNADLPAVIRIFGKKTKRNFILDERVRGKVSIYLPGKISAEQSLNILDTVLALKGFTSVPVGENLWKIVPSKEAKQSTIPTLQDEERTRGSSAVVTKLLSLKFVGAEDLQQLLGQLISPDGLISAYPGTNSLILIDYEDNIKRISKIVSARIRSNPPSSPRPADPDLSPPNNSLSF